ncbi:hypothetical protein DV736_g518, partial [Chaetothyriales sp. CBS 134916]
MASSSASSAAAGAAAAAAGSAGGSNNIKVVARFRPQNKLELANGGESIVRFTGDDSCALSSAETSAPFTFDRVFDMESQQSDIFDFSIRSTVEDVMKGYNGTVFAYGQTGAGKSYTMMGEMDDAVRKGIIPRIIEQMFDAIVVHGSANIEYTVGISYLEIYMERIRDLLNPANDNLPIHEGAKGPYVKGLREIYVGSVDEVYTAMHLGQRARATASTNMNLESSRSHSIFLVTINQRDINTGSQKSGMLYLVDLAGSEKVGKTGASGQTLEEAKKINKSLSALGMVINALTDGKSTHVPYRDSKLTRILQESLGGNSRTTLIINCSPSSYNDAETVSTLRFGTRAKTIKNKAKINAELSPQELKRQLKSAQAQAVSFEKYIASLDAEVALWRKGEQVPPDSWLARTETGRTAERSSTPTIVLDRDERDDFLRRENELQDQVAEKETQAANAERSLLEARQELRAYQDSALRTTRENEAMQDRLNKAEMEVQKLSFQSKEDTITMDSLKEANAELEAELVATKQQLLQLKMTAKETSAALDDKDRRKSEKMAKMLAGFDMADGGLSQSEKHIQDMLQQVDQLKNGAPAADVVDKLRASIVESRAMAEHSALLTKHLGPDDIDHVKQRLGDLHAERRDRLDELIHSLRDELTHKTDEIHRLRQSLQDLQARSALNASGNAGSSSQTLQQQIADFDLMKKNLMRDLQNRCERVVELEISLDETREQYNNVLRSSNNRQQQKKMAFLERNLEQLTVVQRQLVDQNTSLKKEVAIAQRKLNARNERILSLEALLADSQEKLTAANHRFEHQLHAVKERLEIVKASSRSEQPPLPQASNGFSLASAGARIAKPLRGGTGAPEGGPSLFANIAAAASESGAGKRASWFFPKS